MLKYESQCQKANLFAESGSKNNEYVDYTRLPLESFISTSRKGEIHVNLVERFAGLLIKTHFNSKVKVINQAHL